MGDNILDWVRPAQALSSGQAGVISVGLVLLLAGLALSLFVSHYAGRKYVRVPILRFVSGLVNDLSVPLRTSVDDPFLLGCMFLGQGEQTSLIEHPTHEALPSVIEAVVVRHPHIDRERVHQEWAEFVWHGEWNPEVARPFTWFEDQVLFV